MLLQVLSLGQRIVYEYQGSTYQLVASNILVLNNKTGEQVSVPQGMLTDSTACVYISESGRIHQTSKRLCSLRMTLLGHANAQHI